MPDLEFWIPLSNYLTDVTAEGRSARGTYPIALEIPLHAGRSFDGREAGASGVESRSDSRVALRVTAVFNLFTGQDR